MKKLFTTILMLASFGAFSQVSYLGYTYNYIQPVNDSLLVNLTTKAQVYSVISTIECSFKVGKNKTWTQLEAIFEQKSLQCYEDNFGN